MNLLYTYSHPSVQLTGMSIIKKGIGNEKRRIHFFKTQKSCVVLVSNIMEVETAAKISGKKKKKKKKPVYKN